LSNCDDFHSEAGLLHAAEGERSYLAATRPIMSGHWLYEAGRAHGVTVSVILFDFTQVLL
jgi:hypothetical protein